MARHPTAACTTFRAGPATPRLIRDELRTCGADADVPPGIVDDLVLAATEAASNAIRHSRTPIVQLTWVVRDDRVEVGVHDAGVFRHAPPVDPVEDDAPPQGWGFRLMAAAADEVALQAGTPERPGTTVRLVKSLR